MPIHCPIATQRITQDELKQIAAPDPGAHPILPVACNWTGNMPETRHCAISCGAYSTDGKNAG
jgi:hypothetical protein